MPKFCINSLTVFFCLCFRALHIKAARWFAWRYSQKSFIGDVIILQGSNYPSKKKLPIDDLLLRTLTCLNSREKCQDTLQNCKVVVKEMSSTGQEGEIIAGDDWASIKKWNWNKMKWNLELTTFGTKYSVRLMSMLITLTLCLKW